MDRRSDLSGDAGQICRGTFGKSDKRLNFTTASALAASAGIPLVLTAAICPSLLRGYGKSPLARDLERSKLKSGTNRGGGSVTYKEPTNIFTASGNMSLTELSGELIFVELPGDLKIGIIENPRRRKTASGMRQTDDKPADADGT